MDRENINSVYLAKEIVEEILSRLPLKSLFRFRSVSKSWLSLISSEFIDKKNKRVVIFKSKDGAFMQCSLQQLLDQPSSIKPSPIYDPLNNSNQLLSKGAEVLGCCNGLICILNQEVFYLWNPATVISKELPKLEFPRRKFGFGWDGTSSAYKVFALTMSNGYCRGNVYSSKTNSWKAVERGLFGMHHNIGVFACGKIHWLMKGLRGVGCRDSFEFFDFESEAFGRIELPFEPATRCRGLNYNAAEIGGFLHLVCVRDCDRDHDHQSYVDLWVMKGSCWLKLATLATFLVLSPNYFCSPLLFGGGPNGEILLILGDNFLIFSPKDDWHLLGEGKTRTQFYEGHVYDESLVSPDFTVAIQ